MNKTMTCAAALVCLGTLALHADYKPASSPLMTPWGEKITPENAWREYPRPQMTRGGWINLNGLWQYAVTDKNSEQPTKWDGQILVPFAIESALSGVGRLLEPDQLLWYRRSFTAPAKPGERVLLHFGAVDFRSQVFVNGIEITDVPHEGGNHPFTLDVTPALKAGDNELVLSVWDPSNRGQQAVGKQDLKPHGCMYTRVSGIWQTVWLETVPETHITGYHTVTDIDAGTVAVTLFAKGNILGARARVEALDGDTVIAAGDLKDWSRPVTLTLKQPRLWSPESPNLYGLRITLSTGGSTDTVKGYFGMRKFEWRHDEKGVPRFYFNNKKCFVQGTLDQGWWPDGLLTPPSEEAMIFDIKLLKDSGFNMMRKHIKVEPLRYYYLCDTMGIMVWQDMVSGWQNGEDRYALYRRELKEMIDLLQPIPSITMWVPYNEGWGQPGRAKTNMTQLWVKRYDPTRLVNGPSGWTDHGVGDTRDMHSYPGPDMFPVMADRVSVLGEFGGIGLMIKGHMWSEGGNWGYVSDATTEASFARYKNLMQKLASLASRGLAGSVYTQTSDVEIETNGLVTYDRKHIKYPPAELAKLHQRVYAAAENTLIISYKPILPTSKKEAKTWKYTFDNPGAGWEQPAFNDASWKSGPAGFGNDMIKSDHSGKAKVGTDWDTKALWLRTTFDFNGELPKQAAIEIFYDEDPVVYLNGIKIFERTGYNTNYTIEELFDMDTFRKALKKGRNTIAVKAVNNLGGAYIDLGLSEMIIK